MNEDAPDTAASSRLNDHDYRPPEDKPWGLCVECGFGQAAHSRVPNPYRPDSPRAPKGAVRPGTTVHEEKP